VLAQTFISDKYKVLAPIIGLSGLFCIFTAYNENNSYSPIFGLQPFYSAKQLCSSCATERHIAFLLASALRAD
jgi:hypothetical protein